MKHRLILEQIPFPRIPRQNSLFLHYIEQSPAVTSWYERSPELDSAERLARFEVPRLSFPRVELAAILCRQNEAWANDELAQSRADALSAPETVAVLTGQQVGLFAGPLYTVYKAMTALRLAEELSNRGIRAVPVFWMDTDDHDLGEVTRLTSVDTSGSLHVADYRMKLFGAVPESVRSVGPLELPEPIDSVIAEYVARLGSTAWDTDVRQLLQTTYRPRSTFSAAFAGLMARLFRGRGLVLFDPRDPEAKSLLAPLLGQVISRTENLRSSLEERSAALRRSGFRPQVDVQSDSTLLFFEMAGARRALLDRNGRFVAKHEKEEFTEQRLLELARQSPERFSPNVLLRPVAQDHLFPTVAYVGGPAEVAYFAQAAVLYREFGRPMPVIWPRFSATALDDGLHALMQHHGVTFEDCLAGREPLLERLARTGARREELSTVSGLRRDIDQTLDQVLPDLSDVDPTLGPALETARRKISRNLGRIESRIKRAAAGAEADLLLNCLRPGRNLQEREWTVHQLIAGWGPEILEELSTVLRIDRFAHFIVRAASDRTVTA